MRYVWWAIVAALFVVHRKGGPSLVVRHPSVLYLQCACGPVDWQSVFTAAMHVVTYNQPLGDRDM